VTVECEGAVLEEGPVPSAGSGLPHDGGTIGTARATRIEIPRWLQLLGRPVLLVLAWALAGALHHAGFVLVAGFVARLLDPLVRGVERVPLGRFRIRRGLAVAVVYLGFAAAVALAIVGLATVVADQTRGV
jgi:predicted PurR-regulated permease PerM